MLDTAAHVKTRTEKLRIMVENGEPQHVIMAKLGYNSYNQFSRDMNRLGLHVSCVKVSQGKNIYSQQDPIDDLHKVIGHRIRYLRNMYKMSVSEMSIHVDVSSGILTKIEFGTSSPKLADLARISAFFEVPLTQMVDPRRSMEHDAELFSNGKQKVLEKVSRNNEQN